MQSGNDYLLDQQEISTGIRTIRRKVLRFFNDAEILANNDGELAHSVGLYLFGLEEFGKLLLLEDSLKTNPVKGQYIVDMSIFGKGSDSKKRAQAHNLKLARALQELPSECGSRTNSVIVRTALPRAIVFMSGTAPVPNIGTVGISAGTTGTFSDPLAPPMQFTVAERVKGFLVDWDESHKEWNSDELPNQAGIIQISVGKSDLIIMIDKARAFVNSYC
jgi:hypothetical protein